MSPAVQRFGLEADVLRALRLNMHDDEVLDFIADLDALLEGVGDGPKRSNRS